MFALQLNHKCEWEGGSVTASPLHLASHECTRGFAAQKVEPTTYAALPCALMTSQA